MSLSDGIRRGREETARDFALQDFVNVGEKAFEEKKGKRMEIDKEKSKKAEKMGKGEENRTK